jgi:hypothetical protein
LTEIYPPTRQQLKEFLPNYEMIRRFEILFRMVGEDLPDAIANNSDTALSIANSALALISDLINDFSSDLAAVEAKTNITPEYDFDDIRFYCHAI